MVGTIVLPQLINSKRHVEDFLPGTHLVAVFKTENDETIEKQFVVDGSTCAVGCLQCR